MAAPVGLGEGQGDPDEARHAGALAALRADLEGVVERLDELVLEILRSAAAAGQTSRPALERRLTRVRNGLERARHLLEPGGRAGPEAGPKIAGPKMAGPKIAGPEDDAGAG